MKAISIRQPWASLIMVGAKRFETRTFRTNHRGDLLIAASKWNNLEELQSRIAWGPINEALASLGGRGSRCGFLNVSDLEFGKAIAIVRVADCVRVEDLTLADTWDQMDFGDYSPGRFAWRLEDVRPIAEPFKVTGRQGLFRVDVDGWIPEG